MSRGVDVLAVMDRALSACEAHTSRTVYVGGDECFKRISDNYGLPEARAAVAELIEALDVAAYGEYLPETVEQDIRSALDRVRGDA